MTDRPATMGLSEILARIVHNTAMWVYTNSAETTPRANGHPVMRVPICLYTEFTDANFSEEDYLASNPDVAAAVRAGLIGSGREHFAVFGRAEKRKTWRFPAELEDLRREKLARLAPYLRRDMPFTLRDGRPDFLSDELRSATKVVDTSNVSSNGYDLDTIRLIEGCKEGLVLDCGAGLRDHYHSNVVNFEIVPYQTTDVVGVGEALPFKDDTFDGVISMAVLEHVRDPFLCAQEIARVIKPGGSLLCAVPFLQQMHGYPHHYFNATKQGITRLYEDSMKIDQVYAPEVGHPAYALKWFLQSWAAGLTGEAQAAFRDTQIGEILDFPPATLINSPKGHLPITQVEELACGFVLRATKP